MGLGTRSCMVFCYLNAVCAVFISYCFRVGISSMAIASVSNKWDRQQKARAIFNAAVFYLILGIGMTVKNVLDARRERRANGDARQRVADYGLEFGPNGEFEAAPLLDRRAFASSEGEQSRGGAHRQYGGAA
ncbi:hypothetical protein ABB37_03406 [Leptomonas pyrrhocoris]|uniref:Uncharacterized protein n=1 Tax=Leptomonas pyrrhocoris TaxID=157538 RepID=A0A0M9G532_LEPPY|nr:hypothetical protein ABB37_03406 [Leptomonas pyrrhocoris]XP_015660748.1 hypothetical protein ABB37_03406 [Leptomonas pyrrhocoris]XP_015660749.1 hypothetical protein ABB37_03406 [Leptomonas pyrrhocoris]KPA82308.1 hypothetical protein ABB37_03406 [Leptomonas pyrrhocoris]KPA82309.1 hypothetical protein ABB37_03406 [Leptomonas pyrrhocoris]KPA82310.1 hypothetical protein ABB37_03406 [Leptomonas pyrrhocoris]|eukprot:XP_015660747.1 hypothetical protein ABB37_03406 [Leptomonas pyrrhocoris]